MGKASRVSKADIFGVQSGLHPVVRLSVDGTYLADVTVLSVQPPDAGLTLITAHTLAEFEGCLYRDFFARLRKTESYSREWEVLQRVLPRDDPKTALAKWAFCSQFATEAYASYRFLESDAGQWLKAKFDKHHVGTLMRRDFDTKWAEYKSP